MTAPSRGQAGANQLDAGSLLSPGLRWCRLKIESVALQFAQGVNKAIYPLS